MEQATSTRSFVPRKAKLKQIKKELQRQQARLGRRLDGIAGMNDPVQKSQDLRDAKRENESLKDSLRTVQKALTRKS
jgi:hypothetical protein